MAQSSAAHGAGLLSTQRGPYQIWAGQVQPEKQRGFEKLTGVRDVRLSPSRCSHPEARGHGMVGAVTPERFIWTGAPSGVRNRACVLPYRENQCSLGSCAEHSHRLLALPQFPLPHPHPCPPLAPAVTSSAPEGALNLPSTH